MGSWTKRLTCLSLVAGLAVLPLSRHGELAAQTRRADAKASDAVLVTAVRGVEVVVSDLNRSRAFFELLGFTVLGEEELSEHLNGVFGARLRITALRAGSGPGIELLEYLSPRGGRAAPSDARPNDLTHWQIDVEAPKTPPFGQLPMTAEPAASRKRARPTRPWCAIAMGTRSWLPRSLPGNNHSVGKPT